MEYKTFERPGYLGKKRNEIYSFWDKELGFGKWRLAYEWGDITLSQKGGFQIYEDAYYEFFKNNPNCLNWLINTASEIYDTSETNISSGFDYLKQETPNNHIHDIAIRRSVARLGKWFKGNHLVQVRGKDSEGFQIDPGVVPFHFPKLIYSGEIRDYHGKGQWWNKNTIEDFYQKNKLLQIIVP